MNSLLERTAAVTLAVTALFAPGAQAQDLGRIDGALFKTHHTNLFTNPGDSRGFTRQADPLVPRTPAGKHDAARNNILNALRKMGYAARLDGFTFYTSFGEGPVYEYTGCRNIMAVLPGKNPAYGVWIVSAFYDTIDPGQPLPLNLQSGPAPKSPGADLNASGVAAVLCVAEALARGRFLGTIQFILFDASEKNFGGAYHFVKRRTTDDPAQTNRIARSDIRFMISLDCVGYNPRGDGHNTAMVWGGPELPTVNRRKLRKALLAHGGITAADGGSIMSSDHVPFHEAGIDSCVLSERHIWSNPYIYTTLDTTAKAGYIDYAFGAKIAKGVAGFLAARAVPAARLDVGTAGGGTLAGPSGWLRLNSTVLLTAVPSPGWEFAGWRGDLAGCTPTGPSVLVPMTRDRAVTAAFRPLPLWKKSAVPVSLPAK